MPLFFVISGFLFSLTNPEMKDACSRKFIWKKAKRLLVPYVVLGTIIFTIKYLFAGLSHATRAFSVLNFFKMFIIPSAEYSTIGHLWYVFTLFIVFLLVLGLICVRLLSTDKIKLCLVMLVFWLLCFFLPHINVFNLTSVLYYTPFFVMGILLHRYYEPMKKIFGTCNRRGGYKCLIYFALTIGLLFVPINGLYMKIIRAIVGILLSLSLCDLIIQNMPSLETKMVKFSNKTYAIYLLSWFGQYLVKFALVNVLNTHYLVVVAGMFAGGIIFPIIVCLLVDKVPVFNNKVVRLIIGY